MASAGQDRPLFSFGVIADAQYADIPDGDTEGRRQRFREVPGKLREALAALRATHRETPLACVLQLGDIINGNAGGQALTDAEFELVASIFEQELGGEVPAVHVIGNHCLEVPRARLLARLGIAPSCYFSRPLGPGWRLVVLDTTEMSGHSGMEPGSEAAREAEEFVAAHPLGPEHPQMASWNGGVSRRQLAWLRAELAAAEAAGERVALACHHQVGAGAARDTHMAWNWEAISAAALASPAFRLALAGHDHMGGYASHGGRHFVTLEALLEAPAGGNAFAVVHVYADRVVVEGRGTVTSRQLAV